MDKHVIDNFTDLRAMTYVYVIVEYTRVTKIVAVFTKSIDAHNYIRKYGQRFALHKVVLDPQI